jgi:hypothetical protein
MFMLQRTYIRRIRKDKYRNTSCSTVRYARTNLIGFRTLFVIAYIEIYVFRGNPFQVHGVERSYDPIQPLKQEKIRYKIKNMCNNNTKLVYLTFMHRKNKQTTALK